MGRRVGSYRHSIILQTPTHTADSMGLSGTVSWANTITCRASITPMQSDSGDAGERIDNEKMRHKAVLRIRIHYQSGVTTNMRIYMPLGERYFEILSVINIGERNREMIIKATEITT